MNSLLGKTVYQVAAKLRGERTFEYLKEYQLSQYTELKPDLASVLSYATNNIEYYRQFAGLDFEQIPLLSKSTLKEQGLALCNSELLRGATAKTTGGSTGQPVTIYKSTEALAREQAGTLRGYGWAGIEPGFRQARFWGTSSKRYDSAKDRLKDFLLNRTRFSAFNYSDVELAAFAESLKNFYPHYFYGYASILKDFANFCKHTNFSYSSLKAIISTSEILTPEIRETLEGVFKVKVFNEYGCGEVGTIAHESESGHLHVNAENLFVEILDDNNQPVVGSPGRIVLTELHNRVQPLIRYEVGDYATLSEASSPCGRKLPVLENVCGRAYDIVFGPDGRKYHPEFFIYIFEDIKRKSEAIEQFQVVQDGRKLVLNLVKGREYKEEVISQIKVPLEREFGDYFSYEVHYPEQIEREPSGKLRVVKRL